MTIAISLNHGINLKVKTTGEVYKIKFNIVQATFQLIQIQNKLYGEGRRNFKQEKFSEHFYNKNHNASSPRY